MDTLTCSDCLPALRALPSASVDLCFADPPFNIGFSYDVYEDQRTASDYLSWSRLWISEVHRVLKPDGTFWLAIGDDYAAELKLLAQDIGFHCRSWCIWHYTFGVNCPKKFTRSHTHLLYFVKHKSRFTFRADDPLCRVQSERQRLGDKRANPLGRLPDDVWQFSRIAGTHKERAGFHGCQMPEALLGRIIRMCSESGELVLDPFAGSATTLAVAKKLGRRYLGFELSAQYAALGQRRLDAVNVGDSLAGG